MHSSFPHKCFIQSIIAHANPPSRRHSVLSSSPQVRWIMRMLAVMPQRLPQGFRLHVLATRVVVMSTWSSHLQCAYWRSKVNYSFHLARWSSQEHRLTSLSLTTTRTISTYTQQYLKNRCCSLNIIIVIVTFRPTTSPSPPCPSGWSKWFN